jgi:Restriction endonuclease
VVQGQAWGQSHADLWQQSWLSVADVMTGPQFETYFAGVLPLCGFRDVQVVGRAGDGGIDILATDPAGVLVAWQCKRQVARIPVHIVRELIGSVSHEHAGRLPYLVTTSSLTRKAAALARSAGVRVIDRCKLDKLMTDVRQSLSAMAPTAASPATRQSAPATAAADRPRVPLAHARPASPPPAPVPDPAARPRMPVGPDRHQHSPARPAPARAWISLSAPPRRP